jgi:cytochrome oxidase Cu insertion factor (SCO1/SenC/PrrC family)
MKPLARTALAIAILAAGDLAAEPPAPTVPPAKEAARVAPQVPPVAGDPAPDFTLTDQAGKSVKLSDSRGQKVVLVFYRGYW